MCENGDVGRRKLRCSNERIKLVCILRLERNLLGLDNVANLTKQERSAVWLNLPCFLVFFLISVQPDYNFKWWQTMNCHFVVLV